MPSPSASHAAAPVPTRSRPRIFAKAPSPFAFGTLADIQTRSLVASLCLPSDTLAHLGRKAPCLSGAEHEAALSRLQAEHRRLCRHARTRHPAYDLDRHLAARRLLAILDPERNPGCITPFDTGT